MKKKEDKKIVLSGRMSFIDVSEYNLSEPGTGTTVLGLFERHESRLNRFTNETVKQIDQLNILEHIRTSLDIIGYYSRNVQVSVRYIISDNPITDPEYLIASFVSQLDGVIELKHNSHFSELTGYLWTDNELKIGGHDLLKELSSHLADSEGQVRWYNTYERSPEKYLWLEVIKHE